MKKIEIKCEGAAYKPIDELIDLQAMYRLPTLTLLNNVL